MQTPGKFLQNQCRCRPQHHIAENPESPLDFDLGFVIHLRRGVRNTSKRHDHASLLEGRIVAAREHCQRALALAGAGGERGYQAWALKVLGDIVQEEGAGPSEALDHYSASMKLATELAMRPLQAHIHLSRGRLYSREKQVEKARTELSLALTSYRSMEMPFWLNAAEHELNTLVH